MYSACSITQEIDPFIIELRTEACLADPVFEVLKKHGVGLVFSHWTWLPPLRKQFAKVREEADEL